MATINDTTHELLTKLRIISKLKEGQKLDTTNDLIVYNDGFLNWLLRKWNCENKKETIKYLRDLYKSFHQIIEPYLNDINTVPDSKKKNMYNRICCIASVLKDSVHGLDNLSKTYSKFPETTAAIEGIIKDYIIMTFSSIIEILPVNIITEELCIPITYNGAIIFDIANLNNKNNQNNEIINNKINDEINENDSKTLS